MGLKDRLKETAQEFAGEARKAGVQAQGKLGEVGLRRRMDDAAKQLGYLIFRERTQATPAGSDADAVVGAMVDLEAQIARQQESTRQAMKQGPTSAKSSGAPMEDTQEGRPGAQSPPEGQPTDQPQS